jgi:uncharacterized protein YpuA (DUF1002 family)
MMEPKPKTTWTESDEIFYLAPFACSASEQRTLENPKGAGKELRKWAELIKTLCEVINEEGPNAPKEIRQLVNRQQRKIRRIANSLSANGKNHALSERIELIMSKCTLDT